MGHSDDGAGIILEKAFQPGHGFSVEMVGRLIQQEHVGFGEQQPTQCDPPSLAAGQFTDIGIPGRQSQRIGGDIQRALQIVAIGGLQVAFQFRLFSG